MQGPCTIVPKMKITLIQLLPEMNVRNYPNKNRYEPHGGEKTRVFTIVICSELYRISEVKAKTEMELSPTLMIGTIV